MTGVIPSNPVFSNFTFALLEVNFYSVIVNTIIHVVVIPEPNYL